MKNNLKSGITLIALVITIIVLLILAGISISMLSGENSIINQAVKAKNKSEAEGLMEQIQLEVMGNYKTDGTIDKETLISNLQDKGYNVDGENFPITVGKDEKEYFIYDDGRVEDKENAEDVQNGVIIDYDIDLGIDVDGNSQYDWQYFYNDRDNIYIIAEDYIPMNSSLLSNSLGNLKNAIDSHPYSFFYDMQQSEDTVINNGKTGSADLFGNNVSNNIRFISDKYLTKWKEKVQNSPTTNNNAKIVASLMDTTLWGNFANSTKIKTTLGTTKPEELLATGGPTLEMWVKSWNERHGNASNDENKIELEYFCIENGTGYGVQKENEDWDWSNDLELSNNIGGLEDKMFFPHNDIYNECYGYWIISPSALGKNSIMRIVSYTENDEISGDLGADGCANWYFGLRPVVCLPSDITAEWNQTNNIWNIKKK